MLPRFGVQLGQFYNFYKVALAYTYILLEAGSENVELSYCRPVPDFLRDQRGFAEMSPLIKYELQQFGLIEALRSGQVWTTYLCGSYSLEYTPFHQPS